MAKDRVHLFQTHPLLEFLQGNQMVSISPLDLKLFHVVSPSIGIPLRSLRWPHFFFHQRTPRMNSSASSWMRTWGWGSVQPFYYGFLGMVHGAFLNPSSYTAKHGTCWEGLKLLGSSTPSWGYLVVYRRKRDPKKSADPKFLFSCCAEKTQVGTS